jgi:hypothetical protein
VLLLGREQYVAAQLESAKTDAERQLGEAREYARHAHVASDRVIEDRTASRRASYEKQLAATLQRTRSEFASYRLGLRLLLGAALTRALTSLPFETTLLFGVRATDAMTFAGVTLLHALVALTACYVPALKATKVDPVGTLRST